MKKVWAAHAAVLAANIIYGANYSIAKTIMPDLIQPFGFILVRVSAAALLFFIGRQIWIREKIDRSDWPRFLFCALTGVAINQLMFFKGLSMTSPVNSGLIMITNPLFVLLLSLKINGERIRTSKLFGVLVGMAGAASLILFGNKSVTGASVQGDVLVLFNSLSYSIYLIAVLPLMEKYHPVTIMSIVFGIGLIMVLPFGWQEFNQVVWARFGPGDWYALLFVVVGTTFLAYLFNTLGLRELSASTVSVYIYLQPLLAALFALITGEGSLEWIHLVSALLIFAGVYLSSRLSPKA